MTPDERALRVIKEGEPIYPRVEDIVTVGFYLGREIVVRWRDDVALIEGDKTVRWWNETSAVAVALRRKLHPPKGRAR